MMFSGELKDIPSRGTYQEFLDDELPIPTVHDDLQLRRCNFINVGLREWRVNGFQLKQCKFRDCYLYKAKFEDVDFTGSSFVNCDLRKVSFDKCNLEYVTFENCKLDYDLILQSMPLSKHNLCWSLLRNLRVHAQAEGNAEWSTRLLLLELYYSRLRHWDLVRGEGHYKDRSGLAAVSAFMSWLLEHVQRLTWGYGLRPGLLVLNGAILVLVYSISLWQLEVEFAVQPEAKNRSLQFGEALFVSVLNVSTLGTGDFSPATTLGRVIIALQGISGAVFIGLLASSLFRRRAR